MLFDGTLITWHSRFMIKLTPTKYIWKWLHKSKSLISISNWNVHAWFSEHCWSYFCNNWYRYSKKEICRLNWSLCCSYWVSGMAVCYGNYTLDNTLFNRDKVNRRSQRVKMRLKTSCLPSPHFVYHYSRLFQGLQLWEKSFSLLQTCPRSVKIQSGYIFSVKSVSCFGLL